MLYRILKVLVGFGLQVFYRKIHISGLEHIKKDRPQLIASNHPNGFIEPLVMACFLPKPLNFLVRGDVFEKKWLKPILEATYQIPVFRFRDGFSKMRENQASMSSSIEVLLKGQNLLIFAEGGTESIKRLRGLQKGLPRIAFSVLEQNHDLDLEILPVGINFTYPTVFNSEVMLKIGAPIRVKDYFELYSNDKRQAYDQLTERIYNEMLPNVVHLETDEDEKLFEKTMPIFRETKPNVPVLVYNDGALQKEIRVAKMISDATTDQKKEVLELLNAQNGLGKFQFFPAHFFRYMLIIVGFFPALVGLLIHFLPILVAVNFTKVKVKQKEFRASILFVVFLVNVLILYLILIPLVFIIFHIPWYYLFVCAILGLFAKFYYDFVTFTDFSMGVRDHENTKRSLKQSIVQLMNG